jgi:hypothetical protein
MRIDTSILNRRTALALIFAILAPHASAKSCESYNPYKYTGTAELEVFTFSPLPGTAEWKNATLAFREGQGPNPRESFKVEDSELLSYSTESLLWTALRYPRRQPWGTYSIAHPSFAGLERNFYRRFSGAEIARERSDFTAALLNLHRQHEPSDLRNCPFDSELHRSYFQEDLGLLEILLSSKDVQNKLSPREKEDLLLLVLDRYGERKGQTAGNGTSAALVGRILLSLGDPAFQHECEGNEKLARFLENPHVDITNRYPYADEVMESGRRWIDKRGRSDE